MSTVIPLIVKPSETISSTDVNNFETNLSNSTSYLSTDNTKSESISQFHLKYSTEPFNGDFYFNSDDGTQIVNTAIWTPVILTGNQFNFFLGNNFVIKPGEGFRAHFDIWVDADIDTTIPPNYLDTVTNQEDCYQFQFFESADGVTYSPIGCKSTYSITEIPSSTTGITNFASYRSEINKRFRKRQKVNLTLCWINTTSVNHTIENLEVRTRVLDTTWNPTVTLQYGTYTFLRFKN